jgi:hypothetical protein
MAGEDTKYSDKELRQMTQNKQQEAAIRAAAFDYGEGWYEGDVERMRRCLHPHLAKRQLLTDPETGKISLEHYTKEDMVRFTQQGLGKQVPREKLYYKIEITEVFQEVAIVRCESALYVDFLQLVNEGDRWLIINVLYSTTAHFAYDA